MGTACGKCPWSAPMSARAARHHQKWGPKCPSPGEQLLWHRKAGKSDPWTMRCLGNSLSCRPRGTQALAGLTCASPASPAPTAHWENSAVAPPEFLHLQGGNNAMGETIHDSFCLTFPPPSVLLSQQAPVVWDQPSSFPSISRALGSPRAGPPSPCPH